MNTRQKALSVYLLAIALLNICTITQSAIAQTNRVFAGASNSYAIDQNGVLYGWGTNANNLLADGTNNANNSVYTKANIALNPMLSIASSSSYALAISIYGNVYAWGQNNYGQLGDGTIQDRNSPLLVAGLSGISSVAISGNRSVALKNDGTVYTFGDSIGGWLGRTGNSKIPGIVTGLSGVTAIAGGTYHILALKNDRTVWSWGDNQYGQLGDGSTIAKTTPVKVLNLTNIVSIASQGAHSFALKDDGTVWSWGYNSNGQLGNNSYSNSSIPVYVMSSVKEISCGSGHNIALKEDGTVWAWGHNLVGQIGDGTTVSKNIPTLTVGLNGIIQISSGYSHSLALKNDGTVWAWGSNANGRLGIGSTIGNYATPVESIFSFLPIAISPSFSPATSGTYTNTQIIEILSPTQGSTVYYTDNGDYPSKSLGKIYSGPITLNRTTTIKATSCPNTGFALSPVASITYNFKVLQPSASPPGGTYKSGVSIALNSLTPDSQFRYTLDGTTPSNLVGTVYTGPVYINQSKKFKAVAFRLGDINSNIITADYSIVSQVATTPVVSPASAGGVLTTEPTVNITSATPGASIRFTTDGTIPTQGSGLLYAGPFTLYKSATVKAVAYVPGTYGISGVGYTTYTLKVGQPIFTPPQGTYSSAQSVAIVSKTNGSTIRYTLDGSTPTANNGTVYTGPVTVSATQTLKAAGFKTGYTDSNVISSAYTIVGATAATPTFSPAGGTYTNTQSITLSSATAGATIRYTTDYTTPTQTNGTIYTAPFKVLATTAVKAIAYKPGANGQSAVASATYTLKVAQPTATAGGTFASAKSVTLATATAGATLRYTLDGTTPTATTGTVYSAPFSIAKTATLNVRGFKGGLHRLQRGVCHVCDFQLQRTIHRYGVCLDSSGHLYNGRHIW